MSGEEVDGAPRLRCFDLDGCVVESDAAIADGIIHAVRVVGLPVPDASRIRAAIGPPLITTFSAMLRDAGTDPEEGEGAEVGRGRRGRAS